jgi:hypothetical protein
MNDRTYSKVMNLKKNSATLKFFLIRMFMKRILVTGGAGFVGSHLCERLLGEGHEVVCPDNYFSGSKSKIVQLIGHPYFEIVRHQKFNSGKVWSKPLPILSCC